MVLNQFYIPEITHVSNMKYEQLATFVATHAGHAIAMSHRGYRTQRLSCAND